jgi:hypothetical protein
VGAVAGVVLTLGVVVARARFEGYYLDSTSDVFGWMGLPVPIAVAVGAAAGWRSAGLLLELMRAAFAGVVVGAAIGAAVGAISSPEPEDRWAGAVVGGAVGLLAGVLANWGVRQRRRARAAESPSDGGTLRGVRGALLCVGAGLAAFALNGCGEDEPGVLSSVTPAPRPSGEPEAVLILVGDLGEAREHHTPILTRIAQDVELWSSRVGPGGSVVVLVLGDVVYPEGMHAPDTDAFRADSARAAEQIQVVLGDAARAAGATMLFLAGNHDWGLEQDREGARQLRNLDEFLDRARARGAPVDLLPPAGTGGPSVVDAGPFRLIILDTAWWILDAEPEAKAGVIQGLADALRSAGSREVVIAAHHPFLSAGPHGGEVSFWKTVGIRYLLARSGAVLQNLNSRPYKDLVRGLEALFVEHGRPLLFAGGHEHSLQLLAHEDSAAPRFSAVSGAGSKLSAVGSAPGMLFGASQPGYMRVVAWQDGAVDLSIEAAPERFLSCPELAPAAETRQCVREGVAAFREAFSVRIRSP